MAIADGGRFLGDAETGAIINARIRAIGRCAKWHPGDLPPTGGWEVVGWESDTNETIKRVEVEIHQEPTRHIVDVPKLLKWVQEDSMYPAQQTRKEKLRKLLST
jgi:hypothetical protein